MSNDLKERYLRALDSFVEKAKQDKYLLAVILAGSLYHDVVWEKSDIDVILIVEDSKQPLKFFSLLEDGVIVNAFTFDRRQFKRTFESSLKSSEFHSWIAKTTLLYTRDETITELYDSLYELGGRDKELLLLKYGSIAVADLAKAEKWLVVKQDWLYSYHWLMKSIDTLAQIEVILHDAIPAREVIQQALSFGHPLFPSLYIELAQQQKEPAILQSSLAMVRNYLLERTHMLFQPVLDALLEQGATMGMSELHERIALTLNLPAALLVEACEWMVEQGIIERVSTPIELTGKSRAFVDEVAYYYDGRHDH